MSFFYVDLTSYLMSNCWYQFEVNFWSKIFSKVNVLMWNWRHIWCQTIYVNVLMFNWRHIWCQTVDVNSMSIFGQGFDDFSKKSFSRSMSWCENNVIYDVKLLMSMFWCKITSYLTSNQWRQWLDLILTSKWRQIDIKLMTDKIVWRQHVNTAYQGSANKVFSKVIIT